MQKIGISDKIYKKLEWGIMKKYDFLIVGIVLIFSCFIYVLFNNKTNSNTIQVIINNEVIDEIDIYDNLSYIIDSNDSEIIIYKNNKLIRTIKNTYRKDIYNVIIIKDSKVIMSQSNCSGKDCMYMEISQDKKLPIICTNGIVIKISNNDNKSDIII